MTEPETVIEAVQENAASEAVTETVAAVSAGTAVVVENVASVEAMLEENAETSEERHEEILEGQEWLENQFQLLLSNQAATQAQLSAMTTELQTLNRRLQEMETNRNSSTVLNQSTPQESTPETVTVTEVETVVPSSAVAVEDHPAVEEAQRKRKSHRVI